MLKILHRTKEMSSFEGKKNKEKKYSWLTMMKRIEKLNGEEVMVYPWEGYNLNERIKKAVK